ncbi:hypothetical protein [Nevskia sp.]|uniref:alpha/beta hydrolase family protein n=1 Tax=Nevskia sp. TaxID=1929292 RepID=UPI0025F76566|nr:hypothetical protein [Nevskia sp.]
MKPFELLIWLLASLLLLRQIVVSPKPGMLAVLLLAASLLLILMQVLLEGWRKPVLLASLSLLALAVLPWLLKLLNLADHALPARLLLAVAGLLLVASTASNWLQPAVRYDVPGGPYPLIGMMALSVEGSAPPGDVPTLAERRHPPAQVKIWFPARADAAKGPFGRASLTKRLAQFPQRGSQLDEPAQADAWPLDLPEPAPLLFYYPGWPGVAIESAALVRELVSHGYYVATVEYPARQSGMSDARHTALLTELQQSYEYSSEARYRELIEISEARVRGRAADASATLDRLAALVASPTHRLRGRFDVHRAGIIGFSLGGAVATQTVNRDRRFVTAINLDGRHWAEGRREGALRPMLMLSEPLPFPEPAQFSSTIADQRYNAIEDQDDYTQLAANLAKHGGMHVTIRDALHFNFADLCLTSPRPGRVASGRIDPRRGHQIIHAYALAWFDRALRGRPSPLLDTDTSPFPEVDVRYWPSPIAPFGDIEVAGLAS